MRVHELKEFLEICDDDSNVYIVAGQEFVGLAHDLVGHGIGHDENVYLVAPEAVGPVPPEVSDFL